MQEADSLNQLHRDNFPSGIIPPDKMLTKEKAIMLGAKILEGYRSDEIANDLLPNRPPETSDDDLPYLTRRQNDSIGGESAEYDLPTYTAAVQTLTINNLPD